MHWLCLCLKLLNIDRITPTTTSLRCCRRAFLFGGVSDNETKRGEDLSSEFHNDLYTFAFTNRRWFAAQLRPPKDYKQQQQQQEEQGQARQQQQQQQDGGCAPQQPPQQQQQQAPSGSSNDSTAPPSRELQALIQAGQTDKESAAYKAAVRIQSRFRWERRRAGCSVDLTCSARVHECCITVLHPSTCCCINNELKKLCVRSALRALCCGRHYMVVSCCCRGFVVRKAYKLYQLGGVVSEILYSPAAYGLDMSAKNMPKPRARISPLVSACVVELRSLVPSALGGRGVGVSEFPAPCTHITADCSLDRLPAGPAQEEASHTTATTHVHACAPHIRAACRWR